MTKARTKGIMRTITLFLIVIIFCLSAYGKNIYVDDDAAGANDGSSWENAYIHLQDALNSANSAEKPVEIRVAQGTYKPDQGVHQTPKDPNATFQLINGVTLKGGYAGAADPNTRDIELYETILSGDLDSNDIDVNDRLEEMWWTEDFFQGEPNREDNSYHIINGSGTNDSAVLDGFIITRGYARYPSSESGGGMYLDNSSPTVKNCIFYRNSSRWNGGGMSCENDSHPTLTNCIFTLNYAFNGGAMYNDSSNPTLINCIFSYNSVDSGGTISGGSPIITNCTITGNQSVYGAGGIYGGNPTITNCIIWGNTPPQIISDATISFSNIQGRWPGEGNIDTDPLFIDSDGADKVFSTEDDDLRLITGSPCIDAGDNSAILPSVDTDIEGNPRIINGIVDMGAYESPPSNLMISMKTVIIPEGGTAVFTAALAESPSEPVEANVAYYAGDTDITIEYGRILTFDASNYSVPQTVTLSAAEDSDNLNGIAQIRIITSNGYIGVVTITESDNEPDVGILFVDDDAMEKNNGSNWADAYIYLQDALSAVSTSVGVEEIRVAQGIYRPDQGGGNIPGDREATFQLLNDITIKGGFAGISEVDSNVRDVEIYKTILSGDLNRDDINNLGNTSDNSYHIVNGSSTSNTGTIDGFIISGGNADGGFLNNLGAGMFIYGANPTVNNCIFRYNSAQHGGGIFNYNSSPTITNCEFNNNEATESGGGIENEYSNPKILDCLFNLNSAQYAGGLNNDNSNTTLTGSTFNENSGKWGGGLFNYYSSSTVNDCEFKNNIATKSGAGIINYHSNSTVTNCEFNNNDANECGGGMENEYSNPAVVDCLFYLNSSKWGGGLRNYKSGSIVNNCTFRENSADIHGGAMQNYQSDSTITNCMFIENSSQRGGGIRNHESNPRLTQCIFSENLAHYGGGLHNYYGNPTLTNNSFISNQAIISGGGIYNDKSSPKITNCIFTNNSANPYGGGIHSQNNCNPILTNCTFSSNSAELGGGIINVDCSLILTNCILWGDSQPEIHNHDSNLVVTYCDIQGGYAGLGNINENPHFASPVNYDYHLMSQTGRWDPISGNWIVDNLTSPCIDNGDPLSPIGDEPEPNGGRINMGAYGGTTEASKSLSN